MSETRPKKEHERASNSQRALWQESEPQRTSEGSTAHYSVDDYFIDRAIDLAWMGAGRTAPNPLVGAVVVKEGRIVGEGYHARYGEEHAETIALDRAGTEAKGATLYVTLEPCAHQGNTPPCVKHVIQSGVNRVVTCTLDPDPRVNGRGLEMLRERGIEVETGRRLEPALLLNVGYLKSKLGLGSAVTLKMAVTLDGKVASRPGKRDDITGEASRRMAHRLRANHDAVLVGIDTVLTDLPRLDCRLLDGVKPPIPVVLDGELRFPADHAWLIDRRPCIVTSRESSAEREKTLAEAGAKVLRCRAWKNQPESGAEAPGRGSKSPRLGANAHNLYRGGRGIDLKDAMGALQREGIKSILVEGGAKVFSSFLAAGLWDAMFVFVSPLLFGPGGVGLASRSMPRETLGAISAGASFHAGEALLGFLHDSSRRELQERLLRA